MDAHPVGAGREDDLPVAGFPAFERGAVGGTEGPQLRDGLDARFGLTSSGGEATGP
jgi:hypothetical protein